MIIKSILRKVIDASPLYVARRSRVTYDADGFMTMHNADFIKDPKFARAYEAGVSTGSWYGADIRWRAHVACWAASTALKVEGDFVECGVNRGGLAMTVLSYTDLLLTDRQFWLLDTYTGLEKELRTESGRKSYKNWPYEECYASVLKTFEPWRNVHIVKGIVPTTLADVTSLKIAYLHIDMNATIPERQALEHFWPRISTGGVVLHDDYGFAEHYEQKRMLDDFAHAVRAPLLVLPTGQAVLFKSI